MAPAHAAAFCCCGEIRLTDCVTPTNQANAATFRPKARYGLSRLTSAPAAESKEARSREGATSATPSVICQSEFCVIVVAAEESTCEKCPPSSVKVAEILCEL